MGFIKRLCSCLFLYLFVNVVQAEQYVVGAQNIEYFPHYDFTSKVDKGVGWAILEAFSDASGHEFVYLDMPVRRLQIELNKGNVDFVYPDNPRWNSKGTTLGEKTFSNPVAYTLSGTLVRSEDIGKGIDFVKKLAIPQGFTPVKWQNRLDANLLTLVPLEKTYNAISLLQQKEVDAVDLEYHVGKYFTQSYPQLGPFSVDVTLPFIDVPFLLSTLRHPDVIEELNLFLENNQKLITSIYEQYDISLPDALIEKFRKEQMVNKEDVWKPL
ncbi:hypothetical protein Q4561_05215 [Alteromonas sp. 1_MG-2023]|uniref:hypothetical protein n=1 Tax=Alteromonas sp. 1_MG-2023 TaxID=3062669 RepID=UPI0026E4084D|nr:hypothetical protein [Alteromonas sp. 1_MG-2023]MDO6566448.1 hypothetical protein [Alteromonas sp. 1_MG-2023]